MGLRRFGEKEEHEVSLDLTKLHDMQTLAHIDAIKLYRNNISEALETLMLPTEKGTTRLRADMCQW